MSDNQKEVAQLALNRITELEAEVASLRRRLDHALMAADSEATFVNEMKVERDEFRKQLAEAHKREAKDYNELLNELNALRSSTEGKIKVAIRLALSSEPGHYKTTDDAIATILGMVMGKNHDA